MKIKKSELKQIIKEEITALLSEQDDMVPTGKEEGPFRSADEAQGAAAAMDPDAKNWPKYDYAVERRKDGWYAFERERKVVPGKASFIANK